MIRILIVDDSPSMARLMAGVIEAQPDMTVAGVAGGGAEGVALAATLKPDVITMDVHMPGMDGFAAIEQILATQAIPIVVVSALVDDAALAVDFRAFELGAVAVERKPAGFRALQADDAWTSLLERLRVAAGSMPRSPDPRDSQRSVLAARESTPVPDIIGIGGSTGAPQIVRRLIIALPDRLAAPVCVVQHMSPGFMGGMRDWLQASTARPICIPKDGDLVQPGHVYLAGDDRHLTVEGGAEAKRIRLSDAAPDAFFRPSVNVLFASLAALANTRSLGILLTGMGADGAKGLKAVADAGGSTWVQNEATSVVFGMPREAIACGAAQRVLAPDEMAARLGTLAWDTAAEHVVAEDG